MLKEISAISVTVGEDYRSLLLFREGWLEIPIDLVSPVVYEIGAVQWSKKMVEWGASVGAACENDASKVMHGRER